jgi:15-cis-phytoene synthase
MSRAERSLEDSYAFCREMARRSGSSFYPCFVLLPGAKRRAMDALYAFMRHTDDLGDNPAPVAARRARLGRWRESLDRALRGERIEPGDDTLAPQVLPAVADAARRFDIPHEHLLAVIEGVEMDVPPRRYETFDELTEYCRRVASAVALACIHVWGFDGPAAFAPAEQCGLAVQLTNILRDLKEDADAGRVYLPLADLRQCGVSVEELERGVASPALGRLIAMEAARARTLYHAGCDLIDHLDPSARRIFGMMMSVYYRLLCRVERAGADVLRGRVRLKRSEKLRIAARWFLLPPGRAALP